MDLDIKNCPLKSKCAKYLSGRCNSEDIFCIKLFKIKTLQEEALLSADQCRRISLRLDSTKADLEAYERLKQIESNIQEYIMQGNNLYLHSQFCGNGKTRWALRLLNSYFETIWYSSDLVCRGLFINVPTFLLALKDNISQKSDYIQHIKNNVLLADVVVWDEIGSKELTTFENENVLSIINTRIDAGKSNIYTSNLDARALREAVGERLYSRISHLSEDITFREGDKRGLN